MASAVKDGSPVFLCLKMITSIYHIHLIISWFFLPEKVKTQQTMPTRFVLLVTSLSVHNGQTNAHLASLT
jgi:hypothetical protein